MIEKLQIISQIADNHINKKIGLTWEGDWLEAQPKCRKSLIQQNKANPL